jgi:signal transduction histidine kinase
VGHVVDRTLGAPDRLPQVRAVRVFIASVAVTGVALLVTLIAFGGPALPEPSVRFAMLAALVVLGELFPITVPRDGDVEEIAVSTTPGFAIMIAHGAGPAALVLAAASAIGDLSRRKPLWKIAFNVGQYTWSVAAAGATYAVLDGPPEIGMAALVPIVASAVVFFVVNDLLAGAGIALAQQARIVPFLLADVRFQAFTSLALFAMSPVLLIVAHRSPWLAPLLAVPVAAVYWGATASLENTRLVERLEGALEHERELSRVKDDFAAVVSHELRTPLTSIQGYIKTVLQLEDDLGDAQRRSFLQAADRQGERLRRLIEQLLAVARLESHVEPLSVALVDLDEVTRQVVDELRPLAHGHTFDLRFHTGLPVVETDEAKLHQILSNLVENALKYSPPDTRVTIKAVHVDGGIEVSVHDEGPGIPAEEQARVFDRFYQVDSSPTRKVGGTGLGLYICRKMAEAIGGRVWLRRSNASGSVFCVFVPDVPPHVDDDEPASEEPASDETPAGRVEPPQSITASV